MKPIKIEDIQNPEIKRQIADKMSNDIFGEGLPNEDNYTLPIRSEIPTKKESNILVITIEPCTAPRLTRRDAIFTNPDHEDPKKRQRPQVTRYFAYKRAIKKACEDNGFELPKVLNIAFIIPMPDSWSQKKKAEMLNKPHLQTPDIDNLIKAFMDSFEKNDSFVWRLSAKKIWGYNGKVLLQKGT